MRWEARKLLLEDGEQWIDPHVHILPPRRMKGLVRWARSFTPGFPVSEDITPEEIVESLRTAGVTRFFNLVFPLWEEETEELNRFNRDLCAGIPEAVPFGSVHIATRDKEGETLRCIEEYGFVGMKLHPFAQRFPAFTPEMYPMFRVLDRYHRPLLVHTGFDEFYGMRMDLEAMERVLDEFPGMQVVAVHSLFPRFRFAYHCMEKYTNLWLDVTNTVSCIRLYRDLKEKGGEVPGADSLEMEVLEDNYDYLFALFRDYSHRIMYGTDFPVGFGCHAALLEDLRFLELGKEVERNLLQGAVSALLERCGAADGLIS